MPLKLALAARETVARHRLRALEGAGGTSRPLSNASLLWHEQTMPKGCGSPCKAAFASTARELSPDTERWQGVGRGEGWSCLLQRDA